MYAAAVNAHSRGDFVELEALCRALVEQLEGSGQSRQIAKALNGLANARYRLGDDAEAQRLYDQALEEYRAAGERYDEAVVLMNLGALFADRRLDFVRAREYFLESLAIFAEFGPSRNVGTLLANLAEISSRSGEHDRAIEWAEKSRAVFERLGNTGLAAWQLVNSAQFRIEQREFAESVESLRRARPAIAEQLCSREHSAGYYDTAFMLAAELGDYELAARIYGFAQQYRELYRVARSPSECILVDPRFNLVVNALREERVRELMAQGAELDHFEIDEAFDRFAAAKAT
jgi:tetratricopeptide (TPR) repeat protein